MNRFWIPILIADSAIQQIDERVTPGFIGGIAQTIVQNSEPIKLALYSIILLTPAAIYLNLYNNAEIARLKAENESRISLSRLLAIESISHLEDQADLALLLGIESYRAAPTVEAKSRLLAGLDHFSHLEIFLQNHRLPVTSIAFRPDGLTFASGSFDSTIII